MKVAYLQCDFGSGEISPLVQGRVDSDRYAKGLKVCLNYIPILQGPLTRRPGSLFINEVKDSSKKVRLVPFQFSVTQAYIIEFGDGYLRFYMNYGQIQSGMAAYEIMSPYAVADLFQLKYTQSADVLYIVHPNYAPMKLSRTGNTNWTIVPIDLLDGPYLPLNVTTTTLAPGATTGSTTLTASAPVFVATDVGRLVRLRRIIGGITTWGYAKITAFTSTTSVNIDIKSAFADTTATVDWRLGSYSATTGYPAAVTFHEDRLFFGGNPFKPQTLDGSRSGDYENFASTDTAGVVTASHALSFTLNSNDVNVIRWMVSDEKGLAVGTVGNEWVVRAASVNEALSPTNVSAKKSTPFGSANIQAIQAGKSTLFVQGSSRKVREFGYSFDVDGFQASDITLLSEHITLSGVTQMAYQKEPQPIVWMAKNNGELLGLTYEKEVDSLKVGWHRHRLGGFGDAANNIAQVESVAVIPSPDGTRDDLWIVVKRLINGTTKRYIEYVTKLFDATVEQQNAFFVDAGLVYDVPLTITGITNASPAVVTAPAHGFTNGKRIQLDSVLGMDAINKATGIISNVTTNTFEIAIDTSDINVYKPYVSGGFARQLVTNISGLNHLEGQSVSILADGAVLPNRVVAAGAIVLSNPSAVVNVGLGYNSDGQMVRLEAGSQDGTALGKTRRINRAGFLFDRSLGFKFGQSFDSLNTLTFRKTSDDMTRAPKLFSGIMSENVDMDYDYDNRLCWRQDQPLPSTILAIMPLQTTQDSR